jgi:hypothetical protein
MNPLPFPAPVIRDQDAEQLRLLSVFHYVHGGLGVFGLAFIGFHYFLMSTVFLNIARSEKPTKGGLPPDAFFEVFKWFYLFFGLVLLAGIIMNVIAGISLARRRNRLLCLITGGLNCLHMPLGTVLGVFTIIVLNRDSVRAKFTTSEQGSASS